MKKLLSFILLLWACHTQAQLSLSTSSNTSETVGLFRITDQEARKLFRDALIQTAYSQQNYYQRENTAAPEFQVNDGLLHTFIRSWKQNEEMPADVPAGNYVTVYARNNHLVYTYAPVQNVRMHILDNQNDLIISVLDNKDQMVTNASIWLGNKKLRFDPDNHYYILKGGHKDDIITIKSNGVANYFYAKERKIKRMSQLKYRYLKLRSFLRFQHHRYRRPHDDDDEEMESKVTGFMVFNKPKFKPGDSIRMKAFITDLKGNPINIPLELHLTKYAWFNNDQFDTMLVKLTPYRPGAYEFSFLQNEGLKMKLDKDYSLCLKKPRSKNRSPLPVISKDFHYEAYELSELIFKIRSEKTTYQRGTPIKIFLKATDENDLPVLDGRVSVDVIIDRSENYAPGATFIPSKLWETTLQLEPTGETILTLPDSIFPKADLSLRVNCVLKSSSNDNRNETLHLNYKWEAAAIRFEKKGDFLEINYEENGKPVPVSHSYCS
ncbi:hypothetical protein CLV59_10824 [Chitinophaga dinghuensis]|uniref:MG2 domain-containing protein n=1 Tax=Chitinophaga dinghuensis TaxID=1539050 RepID=A0A327VMC1_9BACT|nr:hypothetical protein [Chitinophaga dinghuensis]RAJ76505.1 hypothetical protein CLV59_10824 [Chitinophaga dinghuensis]